MAHGAWCTGYAYTALSLCHVDSVYELGVILSTLPIPEQPIQGEDFGASAKQHGPVECCEGNSRHQGGDKHQEVSLGGGGEEVGVGEDSEEDGHRRGTTTCMHKGGEGGDYPP